MNLIFCLKCFSNSVDVYGWVEQGAKLKCGKCGMEAVLQGFSVGRVIANECYRKEIAMARADLATFRKKSSLDSTEFLLKNMQNYIDESRRKPQ